MRRSAILFSAAMILVNSVSFGQNMTAQKIMKKNDLQMNSLNEQSIFAMKLINKRGKARKRKVALFSKTDKKNNDMTIIRFLSPADVKGVGLLSIEDGDREDQWLYLPAFKKVRRISSNEKTDSFMGSDFSYEDINQNDLNDFEYKLLGEGKYDGAECYIIQSIPVDEQLKKDTAYSKTETWIRKDNYVTSKVKFYNKKGDLFKVMTTGDIRRTGKTDKWRGYLIEMQNVKTEHRTELIYEDIKIDQGVEDKYFTQRYLERGR